jgi:hypothetical protein
MRRVLLVLGLALFIGSVADAGELKTGEEARIFADNVMATVGSGDLKTAFEMLKPYLSLSGTEVDSVYQQTKLTRDQYRERFGNTVGTEFVSARSAGNSLIRFVYVEKTENTAFVWKFVFYKTRSGWVINSFNWGDISKELDWN